MIFNISIYIPHLLISSQGLNCAMIPFGYIPSSAPAEFGCHSMDGPIDYTGVAQETIKIGEEDLGNLTHVKGLNYEDRLPTLDDIFAALKTTALQGTYFADAADEIKRMLKWRLIDEPVKETEDDETKDMEFRKKTRCFIWISFTSNLMTSGLRETIRFLVKNKLVDAVCTTAGGVEEDFMKALHPFHVGSFNEDTDSAIRSTFASRQGNLYIPKDSYAKFEEFLQPVFQHALKMQKCPKEEMIWHPSVLIDLMGSKINNEESVFYWCHKNEIPVFCPGMTDGFFGECIERFSTRTGEDLILDVTEDVRRLSDLSCKINPKKSGVIVLGGGVSKHHILNANLLRNGADFAVYINTGIAYDGSDGGATTGEALSWGKLRLACKPVKIWGEASMLFPFLVAQTFAKDLHGEAI